VTSPTAKIDGTLVRDQASTQTAPVSAQRQIGAITERHCAAEAAEDAGKFDCDEPRAEHQQALRRHGQVQHLVGGHGQFDADDAVTVGAAAGGDQQALGGHAFAVDLDRVSIQHPRMPGNQLRT
jgi:hypothetical protein